MKKYFVMLLAVLLISTSSGCETKKSDDEDMNLPNPVQEAEADQIMQEMGIAFNIPENAEQTTYYIIDTEDGSKTAQAVFTLNDIEYTYRIKPAAAFEDISGAYYDWAIKEQIEVSYCSGEIDYIKGGEGICLWYDVVPGLMYSVFVSSGASEEILLSAANELYVPATDAP